MIKASKLNNYVVVFMYTDNLQILDDDERCMDEQTSPAPNSSASQAQRRCKSCAGLLLISSSSYRSISSIGNAGFFELTVQNQISVFLEGNNSRAGGAIEETLSPFLEPRNIEKTIPC